MNLLQMINDIKQLSNCHVHPPRGKPKVADYHILPSDLIIFYELCGGINLFMDATFPTKISTPQNFLVTNHALYPTYPDEDIASLDDISWSWYTIGEGPNSQYISIDLNEKRLGWCYNSFWDKHPRDSDIIALSFTNLLSTLIETRGVYYWWDDANFLSLGNPYKDLLK